LLSKRLLAKRSFPVCGARQPIRVSLLFGSVAFEPTVTLVLVILRSY